MQREILNAQIKGLQAAIKELGSKPPKLVDPVQTVQAAYSFLDNLQSEHAELFKTKPYGSASTYTQLYENIKDIKNDRSLTIPQLVEFLRTLRDETTGGRRTRRRSGRRTRRANRRTPKRVR